MKYIYLPLAFIFIGFSCLIAGPGNFWGFPVLYPWADIVMIAVGIIGCAVCLRSKKHEAPSLDEAAKRAEAEMDRMHMRDHGEPPRKPAKKDGGQA